MSQALYFELVGAASNHHQMVYQSNAFQSTCPFFVPTFLLHIPPTMGERLPVLFLLCWLFVGQGVFAISWPWSRMEKRDDAPFVPVRRDIQLKFDALGRYLATVSMVSHMKMLL